MRRSVLILLFIIILIISPTLNYGQEIDIKKRIAKCAAIEGELERLECFDQLAKDLGLMESSLDIAPKEGAGKWKTKIETNPIDDSETVILLLEADEGRTKFNKTPALIIRCKSDEIQIYISWNDYLGSEAYVLTRLGKQIAETDEWGLSTDNSATFYPGNPLSFIKSLLKVDTFIAQVTPYNESPVTAVFDVKGFNVVVKPLLDTCK